MKEIILNTEIKAPVGHCFLLSLSIDLHRQSASYSGEQVIAGVTSGIIGPLQSVTFTANHFGRTWKLTSKIVDYMYPTSFSDEMLEGPFKSVRHQHLFKDVNGTTLMTDIFRFEAPMGILGKAFETFFLANYLKKFLLRRNEEIKRVAECEEWRKYLL